MAGTIVNQGSATSSPGDLKDTLIFTVQNVRLGVPARVLDHVIPMVAITPVPDAPHGIVGIINYHGDILPVFSFRKYLFLPDKKHEIHDFLLIIRGEQNLAIIAESISGVFQLEGDMISPEKITPGMKGITGIYRCNDGLLVISHLKELIDPGDEEKIQALREFSDL